MSVGFCPECDSDINFYSEAQMGQKVTCPSCGAYLKVIGLSPIELDWVYGMDEEVYEEEEFEY
jgi:lysine biosynthesis protein LysW